MVRAGLQGDLPLAAGRSRPTPTPPGRCTPTRASTRSTACPTWCSRINHALRRADQIEHAEGKDDALLVRAHRRRRRGRLRRPAQRLRADEGDDRGGRRRRALRGPARLARRSAATWAARCWCPTSQFIRTLIAARLAADVMRRAHARSSPAPTPTAPSCSPATSTSATAPFIDAASARPRASSASRAASSAPSRAAWPTRRTPTCSGARPRRPDLARRKQFAEGDPREVPGQAARLQLLALVQLEEEPRRRDHRQVPARARAPWATSSSSSPWPASTRSTTRCSSWRATYRDARHGGLLASCSRREFAAEAHGYTATRHQREVGTGYFDEVAQVIAGGAASTLALNESTENEQFFERATAAVKVA